MPSFANPPRSLQGARAASPDPLARDLTRWHDTNPDTWPAEWADVPIPFHLADPTSPPPPSSSASRSRVEA